MPQETSSQVVSCRAVTAQGSISLEDTVLVLEDEIDTELCELFDRCCPARLQVDCIDARQVTFLGCPGLGLLARLADRRGPVLPLWSSRAVRLPLELVGLHPLFDLRC